VEAQVAPKSQVHLVSAIAEREIDHGAVFFKNNVTVNFSGGELSLSGDQGGAEHLYVDDILRLTVAHQDGSTASFSHDFSHGCQGSVAREGPFDLTSYLEPGANEVRVELVDQCGGSASSSDLWLVGDFALPKKPPVVDAGADQTVQEGAAVTLKGTATPGADPDPPASTPDGRVELLPYQSPGYRYKVVQVGAAPGFAERSFDDADFKVGAGAFGSGSCGLPGIQTDWPNSTDVLLRRSVSVPAGASDLRVRVGIDNDVEVWWNGTRIGSHTNEGCARLDAASYVVPAELATTGDNLLAVRGHDRGVDTYLDVAVSARVSPPEQDSLRYRWELVDATGPPPRLTATTTATPSFRALDDGRYTFRLTVTEGQQSATDETTVTVENVAPEVGARAAPTATDRLAMVRASVTDRGVIDTHRATVHWGDGSDPQQAPGLVQGTGWGLVQAAHTYPADGTYQVKVTIVDDDGGTATTQTELQVGAAGPPGNSDQVALWANGTTDKSLWVRGANHTITGGLTHANGGIDVAGRRMRFQGGTQYGTNLRVRGRGHRFDPAPARTAAAGYPIRFQVVDYQPGGRAAKATAAKDQYFDLSASCRPGHGRHDDKRHDWKDTSGHGKHRGRSWTPKGMLASGLYWVPCAVELTHHVSARGPITIVAADTITVIGRSQVFEPFIDGLSFLSASTSPKAIRIAGSQGSFGGYLHAPDGGVKVTGGCHDFRCVILADTIRLAGGSTLIHVADCPFAGEKGLSDGIEVAAPPSLLPTLTSELTVEPNPVLPSGELGFQATVTNSGATLIAPGLLAVTNTGTSPLQVTGVSYALEYFDTDRQAWIPLLSTGDGGDAVQVLGVPTPATGVTYPPEHQLVGTQIAPDATGLWAAAAVLRLTPDQVNLLLHGSNVGGIRNRLLVATNQDAVARQTVRFGADLLAGLRAASGEVTDTELELVLPGADPETVALGRLAPGASGKASRTVTAPGGTARAERESTAAYLARLGQLDGSNLIGAAFATGTSSLGPVLSRQELATSTMRLPVLSLETVGPEAAKAGAPARWSFKVTNSGSAPARGVAISLRVDGDSVPVTGLADTLDPGKTVTATATWNVPADRSQPIDATATLAWEDAQAHRYGPVTDTSQAQVLIPGDARLATTAVTGRFYQASPDADGFTATPADQPVFAQEFPNIAFNPPELSVPGNQTGVGPAARPFTDVTVGVDGRANGGTLPAEGNARQAGVGELQAFNAVFIGSFVARQAGEVTVSVIADDGFILGVGGGASRVSGPLDDPPGSGTTPFERLAVMGAHNDPSAGPSTYPVTFTVPGPGTYPYELDYFACCSGGMSLVLVTTGAKDTPGGGKVYLTGHDPDFHASDCEHNCEGARRMLQRAVGFVTNNKPDPRLLLVTDLEDPDPGQNHDPRPGLTAAGLTYDVADRGSGQQGTLDLHSVEFGTYDAVIVASDFGGWLRQAELDILLARKPDLKAYLAEGGGLVALAEAAGDQHGDLAHDAFGFLDCVGSEEHHIDEQNIKITAQGLAIGLQPADINGNFAHNRFPSACGMDVLDTDGDGNIMSLATPAAAGGASTVVPPVGTVTIRPLAADDKPTGSEHRATIRVLNAEGNPAAGAAVAVRVTGPNALNRTMTADDNGTAVLAYRGVNPGTDAIWATAAVNSLRLISNKATVTWVPGDDEGPPDDGGSANPGPKLVSISPADGTTVTDPSSLTAVLQPQAGTTAGPWRVTIRPAGSSRGGQQEQELATGTGTEVTARLDPTTLANGVWMVAIATQGSDGGTSTHQTSVIVDGRLKLGRMGVTYQDLNVPMAGIPIQVLRSYDTLNRAGSGEFGYGWRLQVANFRVASNGPLGQGGWEQYSCGGGLIFVPLCYRSSRPHYVAVTWPDGRVESFDFTPKGLSTFFPIGAIPAYTARPGTTSTLSPAPGDSEASWGGDGNLNAGGFGGDGIYNPSRFLLTAKDGTRYLLDVRSGLVEATDRNHNTLSVREDGIFSSAGPDVTFERDGSGRITKLTDPNNKPIVYGYDADGDLISVTDQNGHTTSHGYQPGHFLAETKGERGPPLRTYGYDADGRLERVTDADGHVTRVDIDLGERTETVVGPDPRLTTITSYSELGDPIRRRRIAGGTTITTEATYDTQGHRTSRTDGLGRIWRADWDEAGNLTKVTDPAGGVASIAYDEFASPTVITEATGAVTRLAYDDRGNLAKVTDAAGHTRTFGYDDRGNQISETDATGAVTRREYDADGRLIKSTDPEGHATSYSYDDSGKLATTTDPLDHTTRHTYDAVGNLRVTTDPLGRRTEWRYDDRDRVVAKIDAAGHTTSYAYDEVGNLTKQTDPLGRDTTYAYDQTNRLIREVDPASAASSYTYDGFGRFTSQEDPIGRVTTFGYDAADQLTELTLPNGGRYVYEYDARGNQTAETDPLGHKASQRRDAAGRLTAEIDPLGRTTTYDLDALGRQVKVTDPLGQATVSTYDPAGRVATTTDPEGATTTYAYDKAGRRTGQTDPLGRTTTYAYDPAGQLVAVTDAAGHTRRTTYDAAGQAATTVEPSGKTTSYDYDALGRLTRIADPLGHASVSVYDEAGQLVRSVDPNGNSTTYSYDPVGRLVVLADALGGKVQFSYDPAGQQTKVVNPRGDTTSYAYDELGNLATETSSAGHTTRSSYDLAGQLTRRVDGRGIAATFVYDPAGQLISRAHPDATTSFTYDAAGRRESMTDPTGTTRYQYDRAGRTTSVTAPAGTITYSYDPAGQRQTMALPRNRRITYTYDAAGLLSKLTDWHDQAITLTYDPDGRRTAIERPNGVRSSFAYDGAGRLTGIDHARGNDSLASYRYTLDAAGNRVAVTSPAGTERYELDALYRLTKATYPGGDTTSYTYDPAGNRLTKTVNGETTGYDYNPAGQLTSDGNKTYRYDEASNLIAAGPDSFTWDDAGRLTSATVDGARTDHRYDGADLRVSSEAAGRTTPYLWDREGYLPTLVDDGARAYLDDDGLLAQVEGDTAGYPLSDALGSVRAISDGAGTLAGSADYDAFGAVRRQDGAHSIFGFTGELTDPAGLIYLRSRYLDPSIGRFLSQDPVQPGAPGSQGYNPYAYVGNNPTTFIDPSGQVALVEYSELQSERSRSGVSGATQWLGRCVAGALREVAEDLAWYAAFEAIGIDQGGYGATQGAGSAVLGCLLADPGNGPKHPRGDDPTPPTPGPSGSGPDGPGPRPRGASEGGGTTGAKGSGGAKGAKNADDTSTRGPGSKGGESTSPTQGHPGFAKEHTPPRSPAAACHRNSFSGDTPVLMADGTTKAISEVRVGDKVLATEPKTGDTSPRLVTGVIVGEGHKDLVDVKVEGHVITATDEHPFWDVDEREWVNAEDLKAGDRLLRPDGALSAVQATHAYIGSRERVFNLTVDSLHTYFVLAGNTPVLVHNTTCEPLSAPNPVPRAIRNAYEDIKGGVGQQRFNSDGTPDIFTGTHGEPLSVQRQWGGSTVWEVPGARNPGQTRVLVNPRGQMGYTTDHYKTIQEFSAPHYPDWGW
jgi:RHS repeat-associated protein